MRILLLTLWIASAVYAKESATHIKSAAFMGRGNTGIAIAQDEDAIFYNPAGLAYGSGVFRKILFLSPYAEMSQDTRNVIREIAVQKDDPTDTLRAHEGKVQHVAASNVSGIILRRVALAAFGATSNSALLFKDPDRGGFESIRASSISDVGIAMSLAAPIGSSHFLAGATGTYFQRSQGGLFANATDASKLENLKSSETLLMTGMGRSVNLGLMYRSEGRLKFSWGLTYLNIGNTTFSPNTPTDLPPSDWPLTPIKQTFNLGTAIETGTQYSKFRFLVDVQDLLNATSTVYVKRLHLGTELLVYNRVGFSAGLNQGYPAGGFFLDLYLFRFDVGFYTEEFGERAGSRPDPRLFMRRETKL
jgi:hypothetical protein